MLTEDGEARAHSRVPAERRPPSIDRADFWPPQEAMENLRRMQEGGVIIAAGSDAGNIGTLHGPSLHAEIALMAEAGLTPTRSSASSRFTAS